LYPKHLTEEQGKNDPHFYGKSSLNLHGINVRQSCHGLFLEALYIAVSNAEKQISTLSVTFFLLNQTHSTEQRASCTDFLLVFGVTNMSQTCQISHICLQTFRFFRKNTDRFYREGSRNEMH